MAQIWRDVSGAMNNIYLDNKTNIVRFRWAFITFSGETQQEAEVRYRKANVYNSMADRMQANDNSFYTPSVRVWNQGFAVGGNITAVDFPIGTFSEGIWYFQARMLPSGTTEWSGWATHKIEITEYEHRVDKMGSASAEVYGPHFDIEGTYGARVVVMNNAGAITTSAEQQFDVWSGDLYLHHGGMIQSVPTSREESDGSLKRTTKS